MLLAKQFNTSGNLHGTIITFEEAGDILPLHLHDDATSHICIVVTGKVKVYNNRWNIEASQGQILDLLDNEPHEIQALESNTKIINIIKRTDLPFSTEMFKPLSEIN